MMTLKGKALLVQEQGSGVLSFHPWVIPRVPRGRVGRIQKVVALRIETTTLQRREMHRVDRPSLLDRHASIASSPSL